MTKPTSGVFNLITMLAETKDVPFLTLPVDVESVNLSASESISISVVTLRVLTSAVVSKSVKAGSEAVC